MSVLEWLESTRLALFIQESIWGYPIVLSCHAIGMAVLVGIVLMINLRLLGFASAVPIDPLKTMLKVALLGLVINVLSGSMLFVANAANFLGNTAFQIKALLLILGIILLSVESRRIFSPSVSAESVADSGPIKIMAGVSVVAWVGVIVAGRLIAYVGDAYPSF